MMLWRERGEVGLGRNDLMHVLHTAEHAGFGNFPQGVFFSFFFGFMSALFVYFETPSSIILFCVEDPLVRVSFMLYSSFSCASPAKVLSRLYLNMVGAKTLITWRVIFSTLVF